MMRLALVSVLATACAVESPTLAQTSQQMAVCADGPTIYGIDVSRFQGDIDWQLVANSGVKYAWIQISRSLTDIDLKFPYNWKRAKEVGILRGAYQRFQPGMDVMGQAKLFVDKLGPFVEGDLTPMLDVEDANGLTGPQIAAAVKQWMDYVEPRVGRKPIIYTGFYFWRDSVGGADFADHPLWIANYSATCPLVPPTWTRWAFHQYSSTATIPGITANTVEAKTTKIDPDELPDKIARPQPGAAGSVEHRARRWQEYLARCDAEKRTPWTQTHWDNVYDDNMVKALRADKAARADYVIDNQGPPEALPPAADRVLTEICRALQVPAERYGLARHEAVLT